MSTTPCFDALMVQVHKEDRPLVRVMLFSMIHNRRAAKHFVVEGPTCSGKSTLAQLAQALTPMGFGYPYIDSKFWMENLVDVAPMGTPNGVECWCADGVYPFIWSKEKQVLLQKPVLVQIVDEDTLIRVSSLTSSGSIDTMKVVNRKDKPSLGFYEWTSPVVVLTGEPLDLDKNLFCTIHMQKIKQYDEYFSKKLLQEVRFIRGKLMPQV